MTSPSPHRSIDSGGSNAPSGPSVLIEQLGPEERYSYVFEGNSQALDQMLASSAPADVLVPGSYDVVHVNAEFADQASDHDPQVARFRCRRASPDYSWRRRARPGGARFCPRPRSGRIETGAAPDRAGSPTRHPTADRARTGCVTSAADAG